MSLFNDTAPFLSISDLNAATPESESLWQATTASGWIRAFEHTHSTTSKHMPSLAELFRRCIEDEAVGEQSKLSPIQLRLLLHPIQALVREVRQLLGCITYGDSHRKPSRTMTGSRMRSRLEEVQTLLQQWYALTRLNTKESAQFCLQTRVNLILYHLISLNTITSFTSIERLAREEVSPGNSSWLLFHCVDEAEEVFFHCGQVLGLLRSVPEPVRPP